MISVLTDLMKIFAHRVQFAQVKSTGTRYYHGKEGMARQRADLKFPSTNASELEYLRG